MKTSDKGIDAIKHFEGFRNKAYKDVAGYWTIGYGHLVRKGDGVVIGDIISPVNATLVLRQDLEDAEHTVNNHTQVQLSQNQFDALVSFVYNLGAQRFIGSSLLRYLNAGNSAAAAQEFTKWDMAGGQHNKGIHDRRVAEQAMFINGKYPS